MTNIKIRDLGKVITGKTPPTLNPEFFKGTMPFLTPTDMQYTRRVKTERTISQIGSTKYKSSVLSAGSTAFVCIGATIGKVAQVAEPTLTNQQINSIIPNSTTDPDYLYYLLSNNKDKIISIAGGAATPIVNKTVFENVVLNVHGFPEQQKISSILGAYDDLIENNSKRIEKLEGMAKLLYDKEFEKKESQRVPFLECIELNPKVKVSKDGLKPYVPMDSLRINSMLIGYFNYKNGNGGAKFQVGDTLFARITPSLENGKTAFVHSLPNGNTSGFGSTEFIIMRSRTLSPELVYLTARNDIVRKTAIKSMVGASGRQRVQEQCFAQLTLPKLSQTTIENLTEQIRLLFNQIHVLHRRNITLAKSRDLLLPRLMSGELEV